MKLFKTFIFVLLGAFVILGYCYKPAVGNGLLCWSVMLLMLSLLCSDEDAYQAKLKESKLTGQCVSFRFKKYVKIVNLDYFHLASEKAFEWTYITVLWVTGMYNIFYGFNLVSPDGFMARLTSTASAFAGLAWCLPALFYYMYHNNWFDSKIIRDKKQ
jgi:hypothetical protein